VRESLELSVWHWFSHDQAIAAADFSRKCGALETKVRRGGDYDASRGLPWSEEAQREHRSYAVASILSSVAFLEASLNELFASARHTNLEVGGQLPDSERQALVGTADMLANNRLLERFQFVLILLHRGPFDPGAQPYQDAQLLVHLRNELVHYKPRWRAGGDDAASAVDESRLAKGLASKRFSLNPLMGKRNPFFPDKCLGHGCTKWAWTAALTFADVFFARLGVKPVHDGIRQFLSP